MRYHTWLDHTDGELATTDAHIAPLDGEMLEHYKRSTRLLDMQGIVQQLHRTPIATFNCVIADHQVCVGVHMEFDPNAWFSMSIELDGEQLEIWDHEQYDALDRYADCGARAFFEPEVIDAVEAIVTEAIVINKIVSETLIKSQEAA